MEMVFEKRKEVDGRWEMGDRREGRTMYPSSRIPYRFVSQLYIHSLCVRNGSVGGLVGRWVGKKGGMFVFTSEDNLLLAQFVKMLG